MSSVAVPKAVLYYSPESVWSNSVLLALEEKGYAEDEIDLKIVDLSKGENFSVSFLRLNAKATVPTLVVPFRDSVSDDAETRYKALTDIRAIIDLIEQSRSPFSKTRTTSTAPAPSLAPATIAFSATSSALFDILHADDVSPDTLKFINARDSASLKTLAKNILPIVVGRQKALAECISESEAGKVQVSEKVKKFWQEKQTETEQLLAILLAADKDEAALDSADKTKRDEFFCQGQGRVGSQSQGRHSETEQGDDWVVCPRGPVFYCRPFARIMDPSCCDTGGRIGGRRWKHSYRQAGSEFRGRLCAAEGLSGGGCAAEGRCGGEQAGWVLGCDEGASELEEGVAVVVT